MPRSYLVISMMLVRILKLFLLTVTIRVGFPGPGKVINPNTDRPEYIYYMLTKDYQTAYANTVIQMTNEARREDAQSRTLAFMQIHRQDLSNSRLGCIQFILILWTVILLAGIVGSLILMHHQGLF